MEIVDELTSSALEMLKTALLKFELELMEDKKSMLIEKIKNIIVEMIHYSDAAPIHNFFNTSIAHNVKRLCAVRVSVLLLPGRPVAKVQT